MQTPQRYANTAAGPLTRAAAEQQAIFFGPISRGRDGWGATICCGTNSRRPPRGADRRGRFPEDSLTEDIVLSARLTNLGRRLVTSARAGRRARARGRALLPRAAATLGGRLSHLLLRRRRLLAGLSPAASWQYLVATSYWLTGWTILVYLSLPVARLVFGLPVLVDPTGAFAVHFLPYFLIAVVGLGRMTGGGYTWRGLVLNWGSFFVHVRATLAVLLRRQGGFAVTSKRALLGTPWGLLWPNALAGAALISASAYALARDPSPAVLGNVSFAAMGVALVTPIIGFAAWQARRARRAAAPLPGEAVVPADVAAPDAGGPYGAAASPDDPRAVRERRDRRRLGAPVAVAAAATLASVGAALAVAAAGPTAPHAAPSDDRAAVAAGRQFLARYVAADGRVAPRATARGRRTRC